MRRSFASWRLAAPCVPMGPAWALSSGSWGPSARGRVARSCWSGGGLEFGMVVGSDGLGGGGEEEDWAGGGAWRSGRGGWGAAEGGNLPAVAERELADGCEYRGNGVGSVVFVEGFQFGGEAVALKKLVEELLVRLVFVEPIVELLLLLAGERLFLPVFIDEA